MGRVLASVALVLASGVVTQAPVLAIDGCTESVTPAAFSTNGGYLPLSANAGAADTDSAMGTISFTACNPNTTTATVTITTTATTMTNGANTLNYTIYQPGSTTVQWTTSASFAVPISGTTHSGSLTFSASIAGGQQEPAGPYGPDAVTMFDATYDKGTPTSIAAGTAVTVVAECAFSVSSGSVAFGVYSPSAPADLTKTIQPTYTCDEADSTYKWQFASANATGAQMRMTAAGPIFLNYYVHDSGGANFGSGAAAATATSEVPIVAYSNQNYTFTFGIPSGQNPGLGAFTDTNVVTLTP